MRVSHKSLIFGWERTDHVIIDYAYIHSFSGRPTFRITIYVFVWSREALRWGKWIVDEKNQQSQQIMWRWWSAASSHITWHVTNQQHWHSVAFKNAWMMRARWVDIFDLQTNVSSGTSSDQMNKVDKLTYFHDDACDNWVL